MTKPKGHCPKCECKNVEQENFLGKYSEWICLDCEYTWKSLNKGTKMTEKEDEKELRTFLNIRYVKTPDKIRRGFCSFRVICKDGFSMSVQGSNSAYSNPRSSYVKDFNYTEVEIGFPSEVDPLIVPFEEDPLEHSSCVFPYVPFSVVLKVVKKHGGFDAKASYAQINNNSDKDTPKGPEDKGPWMDLGVQDVLKF